MRSFSPVDEKLEEADFFLEELALSVGSWQRVRFHFSAFVSSARSVTFALQGSLNGAPDFAEWYAKLQIELKANRLARFFHECRTDAQHLGLNPVGFVSAQGGITRYYFNQPEFGRYRYLPNEDVISACQAHMRLICEIIDSVYKDFGLLIDPDQIYTLDGLSRLSMSIEDVEMELGLPRGYTDIPWDRPGKDAHRIALLRRNIPGSGIKPLLRKHLGRELEYPCEAFEVAQIVPGESGAG
ncbi:hypothetical protein [Glycocaulis sp.]|uniref:hypothetical protein n=1 Tax=Glycocaulis sp. TaxID=1969725 RepID=UPI003D1F58FB